MDIAKCRDIMYPFIHSMAILFMLYYFITLLFKYLKALPILVLTYNILRSIFIAEEHKAKIAANHKGGRKKKPG